MIDETPLLKLFNIQSVHTVNEVCFHPKKPWILLALSHGVVSIWSYTTGTQLVRLEGHDGPVQSVDFHINSSLFVSGGCDGKIKLWDYDEVCGLKSTFDLEGHNASVNDVKFHHEFPLLVSASDDCTVRLWNWLSGSCIAVLSEHLGAVTSASFHPRDGLVLSASLDGRLCIWDIGDLCDRSFFSIQGEKRKKHCFGFCKKSSKKNNHSVRLKNVLEGHKSGVISAIFHPTLPFIFSASDDGNANWWKIGETSGSSDHEPLHPQTSGISCLAYSKKLNAIAFTADGKNFSFYNANLRSKNKRILLYTSPRNLSCLSAHPTKNIFALGLTKGLSLHRVIGPPPAFSVINNFLYILQDKSLLLYDYSTKEDARFIFGPIADLPDPTLQPTVVSLSCSPQGLHETVLPFIVNSLTMVYMD